MNELIKDELFLLVACTTGYYLGYYTGYVITKIHEKGIYNELKGWEAI